MDVCINHDGKFTMMQRRLGESLEYLYWDGEKCRSSHNGIIVDGSTPTYNRILHHTIWSDGIEVPENLYDELVKLFSRCDGEVDTESHLIALYVLLTYCFMHFDSIPSLVFCLPPTTDLRMHGEILSHLCFNGYLVAIARQHGNACADYFSIESNVNFCRHSKSYAVSKEAVSCRTSVLR